MIKQVNCVSLCPASLRAEGGVSGFRQMSKRASAIFCRSFPAARIMMGCAAFRAPERRSRWHILHIVNKRSFSFLVFDVSASRRAQSLPFAPAAARSRRSRLRRVPPHAPRRDGADRRNRAAFGQKSTKKLRANLHPHVPRRGAHSRRGYEVLNSVPDVDGWGQARDSNPLGE